MLCWYRNYGCVETTHAEAELHTLHPLVASIFFDRCRKGVPIYIPGVKPGPFNFKNFAHFLRGLVYQKRQTPITAQPLREQNLKNL